MIPDREIPGVAEAARLLDDMTQQFFAVPPILDADQGEPVAATVPARDSSVDGHAM